MKINEITQSPDDRIIAYIKQHCQKYINEVGGLGNALTKYPLWRGIRNFEFGIDSTVIVPVEQNRRPVSTRAEVQVAVDDWFQEKFGIRFRQSSVFCTGDLDDAKSYGEPVIVLPVGDYDYCWSDEIGDLFIALQQNNDTEISEFLDTSSYMVNKDLIRGIDTCHEIMLHCKRVMLVDPSWHKIYTGFNNED